MRISDWSSDVCSSDLQDGQIKHEVMVFYVEEVELQLFLCILLGRAIWVAKLGPAGQPRLQAMPQRVIADALVETVHELRPPRSWADDAHVATQQIGRAHV